MGLRDIVRLLPRLMFFSRWLQVPLYLGLIIAQGVYVIRFTNEIWHMLESTFTYTESGIMLTVLSLIDVVMISNLLIMVIIGGYEIFVSRLNIKGHPDEPTWLYHVGAGTLKIKLALALISISSIHLLKSFIDASHIETHTLMWQVFIHITLMLSVVVITVVDRMSGKESKAGF